MLLLILSPSRTYIGAERKAAAQLGSKPASTHTLPRKEPPPQQPLVPHVWCSNVCVCVCVRDVACPYPATLCGLSPDFTVILYGKRYIRFAYTTYTAAKLSAFSEAQHSHIYT